MEEIPLWEPVQEREVNLLVNSESLPNLLIVKYVLSSGGFSVGG